MFEDPNSKSVSYFIAQKREAFRVEIRKTKQENLFNSKRFSQDLLEEKNKSKLEIENDPLLYKLEEEKFLNEIFATFSNKEDYIEYTPIPDLLQILKKTSLLIEKKKYFDEKALNLLIEYCFRRIGYFETETILHFCYLLEKIMVFFVNFKENLISLGVIAKLKQILQANRKNYDIAESIFFSFSQISTEEKNIKNLLRQDIILEILITIMLIGSQSLTLIKIISWLIYNITTLPIDFSIYYDYGKHLFPICGQMLELEKKEIVSSNLISISSLIGEDEKYLDDFCFNKMYIIKEKTHILDLVNKCLISGDDDIKSAAAQVAYKVSLGNAKHSELLIQKNIVSSLINLLELSNEEIQIKCLITLTNVIQESIDNFRYCLNYGLEKKILQFLNENHPEKVKKECMFFLQSSTYNLSDDLLFFLICEMQILEIFCRSLVSFSDSNIISCSLQGLENIFDYQTEKEENKKKFEELIKNKKEELNLIHIIENQMETQNENICNICFNLLNMIEKK